MVIFSSFTNVYQCQRINSMKVHPSVVLNSIPSHLPVVHAILSAIAHQQHTMVQLLT